MRIEAGIDVALPKQQRLDTIDSSNACAVFVFAFCFEKRNRENKSYGSGLGGHRGARGVRCY